MFRRIKRELQTLGERLPIIVLNAFLFSFGGVLLWISGGSTWYAIRNSGDPWMSLSLCGVFVLWLITYGLVGIAVTMLWLAERRRIVRRSVNAFGLMSISYILMLSWYAVYFCTRLTLFSVILLLIALALCIVSHVSMRKSGVLISLILFIIEAVLIYFIWFSTSVS